MTAVVASVLFYSVSSTSMLYVTKEIADALDFTFSTIAMAVQVSAAPFCIRLLLLITMFLMERLDEG